MVAIRDMARQSGVSVVAVSHVLNDNALVSPDTRETIMKAVTQLGYQSNANIQALATQVSDTIGIVAMDVSDASFGILVKTMDMVAQQHRRCVLIGNSHHEAEKEHHTIEMLIHQRCNALIVHFKALSGRELAGFMDQIPGVVLTNRPVPGYAHRCVCLDNISGAKMAAWMLLNNGHQCIGYLAPGHRVEDDAIRKEGWLVILQEQEIVVAESWIGTSSPDMQGRESAMMELPGHDSQLTAVLAYNDNMVAGALTTLKDDSIVIPLHLSIIGFDDTLIACYTNPQLATVRCPIASMTKMATELVLQGITDTLNPQASHCFMPTLVCRHSVALRQSAAPITSS